MQYKTRQIDKSYLPKSDAKQPFTLMDCNMRCRGRESLDLNAFHFIGFLCLASPIVHSSPLQNFAILYFTLQYSPPTALRNCNPDKYSQYAAPGKLKRRGFDINKWFKDEDETSLYRQEPSLKSWIKYLEKQFVRSNIKMSAPDNNCHNGRALIKHYLLI